MKHKLNYILLIDDDEPTNFIHELVIQEAEVTENVVVVHSGKKALDYIASSLQGDTAKPDLIFLDINMPGMTGWEFLEQYNSLVLNSNEHIIVVMLTTSLNPDDKEKADQIEAITEFVSKPLTTQLLRDLTLRHFS